MKQMEVTILGQSYILGCPDGGESALLEAVNNVDKEMSAIRDGGKVKARERIAVLAALNLAFELSELEANALKAAHSAPAPVAAPVRSSGAVSAAEAAAQPQLAALLQRLDNALGVDGRLL